jgi:hypothetical protein
MDDLPGFPEDEAMRLRVFLPALYERARRAVAANQLFVHDTAAAAAASVIRSRQLWLRNTQCMNDFSEVQHGLELLAAAWRSPAGERLLGFLDSIFTGFRPEAREAFAALADAIRFESFITCLSEHDRAEDGIGRLSMWRAYSGTCGIALVLNRRPLLELTPGLAADTGPVVYADRAAFLAAFRAFAEGLEQHGAYIEGLGREAALRHLRGSYYFAALATKHPGFAEEREWRIVYNSRVHPADALPRSIEVCHNEPQIVYKLPLQSRSEAGITGLDLAECLEALIIGPCDNPRAVQDAFIELLAAAGVPDPAAMIRVSDIPLR